MQPMLSALVVVLALSVARAVPQESTEEVRKEPTVAEKFEKFQQDVQTFVDNLREKTKATFHELQHSELSNKTRNWLSETFQKLKEKFD